MKPTLSRPCPVELLAPAKDITCGMEAIRHGADAIYIGGPDFGARSAAGNSVEDIARLCDFAHTFNVRIYVTLNTILYDSELPEAEQLVRALYLAGVDALIVQDMALLKMHLPPIALHASTQMDNCTPEKAQLLEAAGFRQIVLAREMSLAQIRKISDSITVPVEAFVHGALCVSYSGRCYASQHCFHRSANRGCCAQFCRLAFDLTDGQGNIVVADKHLLSLRDMNRSASLEEMLDAGVRSFKIEGRLKEVEYVKNVTASYRRELDRIFSHRPADYCRSSYGKSELAFEPDAGRSFNRGFTDYFLHDRAASPVHSFASPKATGPAVGTVLRASRRGFTFRPVTRLSAPIVAGDGLCFIGTDEKLQGFRINRVEGNEIFPNRMPFRLPAGTTLHRNLDFTFTRMLQKPTATRTLLLDITLRETPDGYAIDMTDESGHRISCAFSHPHEAALSPQREAIVRQLSKLGGTCFRAGRVDTVTSGDRFIPASTLAGWRREATDCLLRNHRMTYSRDLPGTIDGEKLRRLLPPSLDFTANVANRLAADFYREHGVKSITPSFEVEEPEAETVLMTCKHCIRRALDICKKQPHTVPDPLFLRLRDGRTFPLRFDCTRCEMQVLKARTPQRSGTEHRSRRL